MNEKFSQIDSKELQLPDTTFSRDIESKIFQAIIFQCLLKIEGISLPGKNLIDSILGRDAKDRYTGIYVEQDLKEHSVSIKVEVNIKYGLSIPEKSEEIQSKIIEEISKFTGLHVSCVHVIFKHLILKSMLKEEESDEESDEDTVKSLEEEYEGF
ncbi:MAG: hypothetical protein K1060chlam5_00470 [Candidatus Anoxychlamydiales bacterium]|nr:hypothetical protein [Candidatus Anoxychlamydiales bacterium]